MRNIILIPVILLSFVACKDKPKPVVQAETPLIQDSMFKLITIDTIKEKVMEDELQLSGQIVFDENKVVKVFPNVSGVIVSMPVSIGDKVYKGQLLATLRSADIAGSYSDLKSSDADIAITERQLKNTQQLYEKGIASEKDLTEAKNNYAKALAVKEKIINLLSINGGGNTKAGGTFDIKSPIDGYIVEKKSNPGNFIRSDMADNLFTISNLQNVWVYANVYESDISRVKEGYRADVRVIAYPDKVFSTTVDKVSEVLDPNNKIQKIRLKLANPNMLLKPEMFSTISVFNSTGRKALAIKSSAIIFDNSKNYILIYRSRNQVEIREISILKKAGDWTYIAEGVSDGEPYISKRGLLIFNSLLQKK
ncbi:MAG: efflux RND transporter periplasmic adaptor subunit [Sediminibacterium sp.]|nr:efflux RND transporter periplasmic adaptor subunit [Sediminibacterium sp.]